MTAETPDRMKREKIDFHQLKHLLRCSIKLDLRSASGINYGNRMGKLPPLLNTLIFYVFIGGAIALMVGFIPSPFIAAVILISVSMVFSAIQVLLEFGSIIISPDDFDIISPLPVSSRTFFFSKLLNLFFFTMLLTTALAIAPVIVYSVKTGSIVNLCILVVALQVANCTMALAMAAVYTSLLRIVSRERLSSALNYVQLAMATVIYMGYFIASDLLKSRLMHLQEITDWWLYILPSTWYASLLGLNGVGSSDQWMWSLGIGVVVSAGLYFTASRYLSVSYSESIAKSETRSDKEGKERTNHPASAGIFSRFLKPEESAIFSLIRAQFKHDSRFKMTVLSVIPLAAMYIVMAVNDEHGIANPFNLANHADSMQTSMVFMALGLFPMMVQSAMIYSKTYQASWVFFATPADLSVLILATRKLVRLFFMTPLVLGFAVVFSILYGNVVHGFLTILIVYFLSVLSQSLMYIFMPEIPFSKPVEKAASGVRIFFVGITIPIILIVTPMSIILKRGWSSWLSYAITFAVIVAVERVVDIICRRRVASKASSIRFAG